MAVPISPVRQHTPVLEMEQPWWQEQDFLTKTWSLSSFIQQVFLQEKFFLQKRIYIIIPQFLQHEAIMRIIIDTCCPSRSEFEPLDFSQ